MGEGGRMVCNIIFEISITGVTSDKLINLF
jgi:hypothetical protein